MDHNNKTKIVTITLNWNGLLHTLTCLKSLKDTNVCIDSIVVDNFSEDSSVEYIKKYFPSVKVIENSSNLGYSKGYNVGIKEALKLKYDFFIIHNNDVKVAPDSIEALVNVAKSSPRIGVVTGKVYHYNDRDRFQYAGGRLQTKWTFGPTNRC